MLLIIVASIFAGLVLATCLGLLAMNRSEPSRVEIPVHVHDRNS